MSLFGKNIKKIRSVRGLTQAQLADSIDVSRGVISSYEEGRAEPKIETILKTAEVFNLSIDQLLKTNLTVNQLSGFSIPEIPEKDPHNANNISKSKLIQFWIADDIIPFATDSIHYKKDFEFSETIFVRSKSIDFGSYMLLECQKKWYLGITLGLENNQIQIAGQIVKRSDISQSFEVIGTYQSLKNNGLLERVSRLEQKIEEIQQKLNLTSK